MNYTVDKVKEEQKRGCINFDTPSVCYLSFVRRKRILVILWWSIGPIRHHPICLPTDERVLVLVMLLLARGFWAKFVYISVDNKANGQTPTTVIVVSTFEAAFRDAAKTHGLVVIFIVRSIRVILPSCAWPEANVPCLSFSCVRVSCAAYHSVAVGIEEWILEELSPHHFSSFKSIKLTFALPIHRLCTTRRIPYSSLLFSLFPQLTKRHR